MRRTFTALALALALLLASAAGIAQGDLPVGQDIPAPEREWLASAALYQGRVLLAGNGIYQAVPGEDEVKEVQSFAEEAWQQKHPNMYRLLLAAGEGKLYGLDTNESMLYTISLEEAEIILGEGLAVDLSPLKDAFMGTEDDEDGGYVRPPAQMIPAGDRLYMIANAFGPRGPEVKLFSYELKAGGAPLMHVAEHVQQLAAYKEGKLLALVMNTEDSFDMKTGQMRSPQLAVWDPQEDTLTPLEGELEMPWRHEGGGLAYDPEGDFIYLSLGNEIYRRDVQGKVEVCAYLNPTNRGSEFSGRLLVLPEGRLAYASSEGVSLRSADPAHLPAQRLVIYGSFMNDAHKGAMQQLAGTAVTFLDDKFYTSAQELGQALVGGEDQIDIFVLRSDQLDLNSLMAKGYTADLSGSQVIADHMDALYPMMSQVGTLEHKALLVPIAMDAQMRSYYPKLVDQVGIEIPVTYGQMLDLLQRWNDELGEQHPDLLPMHEPDYNLAVTILALQLYASEMAATGQPFSFGDPLLKEMLQQAQQLRTEDIAEKVDWSSPGADMEDIYSKAPLIEDWYRLDFSSLNQLFDEQEDGSYIIGYAGDIQHDTGYPRPFQLAIEEGKPYRMPLMLTLMGVNPRGQDPESAIQYLEAYIQNLDPATLMMMNPSLNDPLPNPDEEHYNRGMQEYEESLREQIDKAEGAEKTELEAVLERAVKDHQRHREDNRWLVRPEAIQLFREMMENGFVRGWDDLNRVISNPDMSTLLMRFIGGQMPLEQFLDEAEGKLRLMRLEDQ